MPTTRIEDNFVTDVGLSAEFVGHLTGRAQAGHFGTTSFMLTREIRFNPGDATHNAEDSSPTRHAASGWRRARLATRRAGRGLMIYTR
jgi:hypothetical protein